MTQQAGQQYLTGQSTAAADLDAWFIPGKRWVDEGIGHVSVRSHQALSEAWSQEPELAAFANQLADHSRMTGSQLFDLLEKLPARTDMVYGERLQLLLRVLRLAFAMVESGDVLPYAASLDQTFAQVRHSFLQLNRLTEDDWMEQKSTHAQVAGLWVPALRDEYFLALRRFYINYAEGLFDGAQQSSVNLVLDQWLIFCVDAFIRRFHDDERLMAPPLETKPGYRIPYRGEKELMDAWKMSLLADQRGQGFSADPWLMWRTLRQTFAGSGWTEDRVLDQSGKGQYHLEFELLPPARDASILDWRLRFVIAHNHFDLKAPLSQWWSQPDRAWRIGRDKLVGPDAWFLPELLAAGAECPAILESLRQACPVQAVIPPEGLVPFLGEELPRLQERGYIVSTPNVNVEDGADVRIRVQVKRMKNAPGGGSVSASSRNEEGWFQVHRLVEFDWSVVIDNHEISRSEFEQMVARRSPYIQLGGSWRLVPLQAILDGVQALQPKAAQSMAETTVNLLELSRAVLMNEAVSVPVDVSYEEEAKPVREMLEALCRADRPEWLEPPTGFTGTLRHYQQIGFSWLVHLRKLGVGGCLADDMGLGKTIQVLAYLMHLQETEGRNGPHLLICPTSLLQNWKSELHRFTPDLKLYIHHGPRRNEPDDQGRSPLSKAIQTADIVMTTYATIVRDIEGLSELPWDALVIDEAQNIKNSETKQAGAVRRLGARHRVALTGTPVENRLEELWSIMEFLNPGYLGSSTWFRRVFAQPIASDPKSTAARRMQLLLQPVLLRRRKTDPQIQVELPDKWEVREHAALTAEQAALYQSIVNRLWTGISTAHSDMSRRGQILAALVRLKQLCDHPCLVTGGSGDVRRSGKLKLLLDLMEGVVDEGDSALIFTQFRDMGELLCQSLEQRFGWRPKFLHGGQSAAVRGDIVERFQSGADPSPVLVLSLKAGGVGLNLTRANHVFHFDRWWNPAVEDQATDRAFRIGQTKDVQVHKLVCSGTLEDRIDELIYSKRALSAAVVGESEGWLTEMDNDALRSLLALDADVAMEEDDG